MGEVGSWMFDSFACPVLAIAKAKGGAALEGPILRCMDALANLGMASLDDQIDSYIESVLDSYAGHHEGKIP